MPLFHIHGLIAAVLSSLSAGASVVCHAGLRRAQLLSAGSMRRSRPGTPPCRPCTRRSWRARARNAESVERAKLRFIRSSSASLPPQVMAELEAAFGCPVIEAYGMTEAAHQMASNPLPPRARKPGSVGPAAGPEMAIMAMDGAPARRRTRSARSSSAAKTSPPATRTTRRPTREAFAHGWFRTGDQGTMDAGGLSPPHRPAEGDHQPRRREDLAARGRRGADGPSGGRAGRHLRDAAREARRGRGGGGRAARGPAGERARAARFLRRRASPTSRCRASSSSWTRSRRARPASCSASAWRRSSG